MAFLKLLLIRHGESVGNQQGQMLGWLDDELSDRGNHQVRVLAQRLAHAYEPPTHIYSSPIRRAAQTTEILIRETGGLNAEAVQYRDELKEFQAGIFTGLTWAEAQAQYPDLCDRLEASPDWLPIPDAETLKEGRDRATQFIQYVLTVHQNGDRLWIVTHAWILQHLLAAIMGTERTWGFQATYTGLFELWLDRDRWSVTDENRWNSDLWQLHHFNCDRHLH
jgi:2,3-bisphosphoglycerate-dependent phosphoglycerate mutase